MLSIFRRKRHLKIDIPSSGADEYAGPSSRVVPPVESPALPAYSAYNRSPQPLASLSSHNEFNRSTESLPPPYEESPRPVKPFESNSPTLNSPTKARRSLGSLLRRYNYGKGGYNGLSARRARTVEMVQDTSPSLDVDIPEDPEISAIEENYQRGGI